MKDENGMVVVRTVRQLRDMLRSPRRAGKRIGLVPTMGAFHAGHIALMSAARAQCDVLIVSLFVNPTQFGDPSDLANYPRNDARDETVARNANVDFLFVPSVGEMYPTGFNTTIEVGDVTAPLEGAARGPAHFHGVATVVAKLFNIVQPQIAYFGQKDAQQTVVIRKMVRDLNLPAEITICPTVRESDGLAMSSRNARLSGAARARASALYQALQMVVELASETQTNAPPQELARVLNLARKFLAERGIAETDIEYLAAVDPETLHPVTSLDGRTLVAIAARVGGIRLIDNIIVTRIL
ncbi:MAG: pantoate--beta-alanine ligase [Gemmatimonadaceae bacterium]